MMIKNKTVQELADKVLERMDDELREEFRVAIVRGTPRKVYDEYHDVAIAVAAGEISDNEYLAAMDEFYGKHVALTARALISAVFEQVAQRF